MSSVRVRSPALSVNLAESATCGNPPTGDAARNAKFSAVLHRAPAFGGVRPSAKSRLKKLQKVPAYCNGSGYEQAIVTYADAKP